MANSCVHIGIPIGPPPLLVSGMAYWPLTPAEQLMLTGFRLLNQQGNGSMVLELRDWKCTRFDVHPNVGGVPLMNAVLEPTAPAATAKS